MYAIIQIGSHQHRVETGNTITVEKLHAPVGSEVEFQDVLLYSDGKSVKTGKDFHGKVFGTITIQDRGPKLISYKRKRRKGYHRKIGHRQDQTSVEITKIEA